MKSFFAHLLAATLVLLASASCSQIQYVSLEPEANSMWVGKTHAEIVRTYGAPSREASDGLGGTILVYEKTITTVNTYGSPTYGGIYGFYYHFSAPAVTYRTETETEIKYAHFYINSENCCYKVDTNLERPLREDEKAPR